ncbi:DNA-binding protein WhiA [Spiroplasma endosymbiont of Crioceris asparagi]|uniref:DNA-binding protein WhiA n=1 Tax=Spiroplasma endosymbiont of Crioceris asparagi TaxID=3066286 RepID=UPI0030D42776
MSFSIEVKEEIVLHTFNEDQTTAFLSGFIKHNGEILFTSDGLELKISSSSNQTIREFYKKIKNVFDGKINIRIVQYQKLKKNKVYELILSNNVKSFLEKYEVLEPDTLQKKITLKKEWVQTEEILRAYIAGTFIATGSVNSPKTSNYHLEIQLDNKKEAIYLSKILKNFNFKIIQRKNKWVMYIKKSLLISDFLKFIDVPKSVIYFENTRIKRDYSNNINRMINIDIYNQQKSIQVSEKQTELIKNISEKKYKNLSYKAKKLCELRIENPDSSFAELEVLMNEAGIKITKSGISNLFKIIAKASREE